MSAAIGIGCRASASVEAIVARVREGRARACHTKASLHAPAGLRNPALAEAASRLGLALHLHDAAALAEVGPRVVSHSLRVAALFGVGSVAEAAALAGAGQNARIVVPKFSADGVSCAVASEPTVHFIGAGPGAADLITLRGRDLIARSPVCLYAGSLVPAALLSHCPTGARIVDTAPMTLDEIVAEMAAAQAAGLDVARLHSGDLSIWSALGEQTRRLRALDIPFDVTPGVPAFAAAAAALQRELTLPEVAQSLVLTRTPGRASAMPERENLAAFAATGATLAIHLSIHALDSIVAELTPFYGADCPVAIVYRASWPDERIITGALADIAAALAEAPVERTALILVGRALAAEDFRDSALYDPWYRRRYRGLS